MAQLIQDDEEYIYDAICNGMINIPSPGPCFKYSSDTMLYHYSNSKYPNKNYKKTYNPITKYQICVKCNKKKKTSDNTPDKYNICSSTCIGYNLPGHAIIKRGDVVHFGNDDYRNNNKLLYDGIKLISLYTAIDDYGSVPPQFKVGKIFKPTHWIENYAMDHNTIIFLEPDLFETIKLHKYVNNQFIGNINILDEDYIITVVYYNKFNSDQFKNLINSNNIELIINDTHIIIQSKNTSILDEQKYLIESKFDYDNNNIRNVLSNENNKLPIKCIWNHKLNCNEWFVNDYLITISVIDKDEKILIPEIKKWLVNKKPVCSIIDTSIISIDYDNY